MPAARTADRLYAPARPDPEALAAVAGLRRAGQIDYLLRCLLTAAWSQALRGDPDAARAALDEALQIAGRSPTMPLFLADVRLDRARLWWAGLLDGGGARSPGPAGQAAPRDRPLSSPHPDGRRIARPAPTPPVGAT